MRDIDVIYLYEHVARELDVACAVKCIAEQHFGMQIELVQWPSGLHRAFAQFRPRIIVLPFCYLAQDFASTLLEWRKSVFFNLAWEQLLYPGTRVPKTPGDEFARKHVMHHAWSDHWANYLQDQGIPEKNVFTNGHPAYMLYEEPYRQFFKQRQDLASQFNLNVNRRWIFFPENFAWAFYPEDRIAEFVRRGIRRDEADTMRRFSRQSLEETMRWCLAIANHGNVELIIRPRPITPLDDFKAAVQQIIGVIPDRMHFNKEYSVREWIIASDLVISSYSTSLIEAAIAGKTIYLLEPYPLPKLLHVDWHEYVTHITTQNEFINACLNSSLAMDNHRLAKWARTTILSRGDAIWNLANLLARIGRGEIRHPPFPSRKTVTQMGRFRLPKWALYEYRRFRDMKIRRTRPIRVFRAHEKDHLDPVEIEQRTSKWKNLLACYDNRKPHSCTSA